MEITLIDAEQQAFDFLMEDLKIFPDHQEWFTLLSSRLIKESWYVVEIGVAELPDKWIIQVYDSGCDPSYTFSSSMPATEDTDLAIPQQITDLLTIERRAGGWR